MNLLVTGEHEGVGGLDGEVEVGDGVADVADAEVQRQRRPHSPTPPVPQPTSQQPTYFMS